jgi:hypothetical protein
VNPEVLEKLLQEAQKESSSKPNSPLFLMAEAPLPSGHNEYVTINPNESSTLIISSTQLSNRQRDGELIDVSNDASTSLIVQMEEHSCSSINSPITIITPPTYAPPNINYKNSSCQYKQDVSMIMNTSSLSECTNCAKNRQEINKLLEIQLEQQRQILMLRKQNEDKLLSRTPQLLSSSQSFSHASNEDSKVPSSSSSTEPSTPPALASSFRRRQSNSSIGFNNSSYGGAENNQNDNYENSSTSAEYGGFLASNTISKAYGGQSNDWMKYFSSRPQINPPK